MTAADVPAVLALYAAGGVVLALVAGRIASALHRDEDWLS